MWGERWGEVEWVGGREGGERGSLILFFNSGAYIVEHSYGRITCQPYL